MAIRRRERRTERSKLDATPPWDARQRAEPEQTTGPFDVRDAPEDDISRVDLGALRVAVWPGVDVRLDLNEARQVIAVSLATSAGQMQLGVFAAPRNEGIWDEVREELRSSLKAQGGSAQNRVDGPFGTELVGRMPTEQGGMAVRFVGVDGPRWFVRAMLLGGIATDTAAAAPFEAALRQLVVVRGTEPLPVREPVPLTMPKEAGDDGTPAADGAN